MSPKEEPRPRRIVLTDSGLGGLSICAELERELRESDRDRAIELVYVNAWPDPAWGYNDLPDPEARALVLDKALARMAGYAPDLIVVACNTLSILYEMTEFSRNPPVPVRGIVDEGVDLFERALAEHPGGGLLLFGTKTTIESGEHIKRLARRGIAPERLAGAACHRLAAVIDDDPESPAIAGMIDRCIPAVLPGTDSDWFFAGLVCTHYGYVREAFQAALARKTSRDVEVLDPNSRLAVSVASSFSSRKPWGIGESSAAGPGSPVDPAITVEVVSKIELGEAKRRAIARKLEAVSPATARALLSYTWIPDLF